MTIAPEHRFPWLRSGLLALGVAVAFALGGLLLGSSVTPTAQLTSPSDADPGAVDQEPRTLLFIVTDDDGGAVGAALTGVDDSRQGLDVLYIPVSLVLPTVPASTVARPRGPIDITTVPRTLEALLGTSIDSTMVLSPLGWSGLAEATQIQQGAIATALPSMLAGLPEERGEITGLLTSLGSMARTSTPNEQTVDLLARLKAAAQANSLRAATLPVRAIRGGESPASIADAQEARALAAQVLPYAGGSATDVIEVSRAGASVGTMTEAVRELDAAGWVIVRLPTQEPLPASVVRVPEGMQEWGQAIAGTLGLPDSAVDPVSDATGAHVLLAPDVRIGQ